jgi:hypothetical protein
MTENRYNWSKLFNFRVQVVERWSKLILIVFDKFVYIAIIKDFLRKEFAKQFLFEYFWAILPVFWITFHKWPAINIANIRFSICPQQIKTTNLLAELLNYPVTNKFLIRCQYHRIAVLLPLFVTHNHSIQSRRFTSLSVHIVWSNCIHFYIKCISWQILFVNVVPFFSNVVLLSLVFTWWIFNFSE